jgi:hypothetical protein
MISMMNIMYIFLHVVVQEVMSSACPSYKSTIWMKFLQFLLLKERRPTVFVLYAMVLDPATVPHDPKRTATKPSLWTWSNIYRKFVWCKKEEERKMEGNLMSFLQIMDPKRRNIGNLKNMYHNVLSTFVGGTICN